VGQSRRLTDVQSWSALPPTCLRNRCAAAKRRYVPRRDL